MIDYSMFTFGFYRVTVWFDLPYHATAAGESQALSRCRHMPAEVNLFTNN